MRQTPCIYVNDNIIREQRWFLVTTFFLWNIKSKKKKTLNLKDLRGWGLTKLCTTQISRT